MSPRARFGAALALAVALSTAGCSQGPEGSSSSGAPDGPDTVRVSSCGRQLAFASPPERAVTLDQAATETLLELGLQDRMAGTSNLVTKIAPKYRAAYEKVPVLNPKILTGEQLRAAAPDFVISSFRDLYTKDRVGTREELGGLDLPAFLSSVECPGADKSRRTAFDRLFKDYEELGRVFGVRDRAAALVAKQREVVSRAEKTGERTKHRPSVAWVYSVYNGVPYVAGSSGIPSDMSRLVGAENVFDDVREEWPEVSWEEFAERDPEVIVVGDLSERGVPGDSAEEKIAMMRKHPVVSQLKAVRENRFITVPGVELDPSVRSVHALQEVVDGLRDFGRDR
ncbi:ABC transporter substrate-binding protein [Streptomyces sp. NA04227]|uniref:ABC transporter substrate-binding protein n=1 Tax=Streptomyces sp. NA04227 TaxID=2742136 RepID=UPI0015913C8C|nr:ABC transporter substrate-binding protein [Streptomyces sp. NA04227]QKW10450.1 ABC transporter substrate-binding protein [Streptomyces sp. NA04227]